MILSIVRFKLPQKTSLTDATQIFQSTAAKYVNLPGLVRKHYYLAEDGEHAGGVYLWKSRADAEACYTPEWRKTVAAKYGTEPEITWVETPVIVDNVSGRIETA